MLAYLLGTNQVGNPTIITKEFFISIKSYGL